MGVAIKLGDFVKKELLPIAEGRSANYEADFDIFWQSHSELREGSEDYGFIRGRFVKTRFLFDLLKEQKEGGLWSYCYRWNRGKEPYQTPQRSLQQLFHSVVDEEKYSGCHFFADCDEIVMLYQEMAVLMGIGAVDIRLVQDNHVNLFVPLSKGVEMRLDPTGISRNDTDPLWNLPKNNYVPKGSIPEEYEKKNLASLRRTLARRGSRLGETPLNDQVAERLLAQAVPDTFVIPKNWQPFAKGYGDARSCYNRFLKQYSHATVDEAVRASEDPLRQIRRAEDTKKYLSCLETTVPMMERLGRTFAHIRGGGFRSSDLDYFSMFENDFLEAILTNHITYDKYRFHLETESGKTFEEKVSEEKMHLQEQFRKWNNPPFYWTVPKPDSFTTGAALIWLQQEDFNNPGTISFLADLVHIIESHSTSGF